MPSQFGLGTGSRSFIVTPWPTRQPEVGAVETGADEGLLAGMGQGDALGLGVLRHPHDFNDPPAAPTPSSQADPPGGREEITGNASAFGGEKLMMGFVEVILTNPVKPRWPSQMRHHELMAIESEWTP